MKILFLSHRFYPDIGGIEVNSDILARAFQKAGHSVRLITWSPDDGKKDFPFPIRRNPGVLQLCREHSWADIVYENNICLRLAWPSLLFRKPSVVALRSVVSRPNGGMGWQDKLKQMWLNRARSVIAVSDFIRREFWPAATVIGNPYRANFFKLDRQSTRKRHFVFLGRLVSDKGADFAIRAIHQLSMDNYGDSVSEEAGCTLTIIGDGPYKTQLEKLAYNLGIRDRVRFAGILTGTALVSCLNDHRYILVPSLCEEAFGNVALEGMACGCIPIVSDAGGLPDAVGKAGLVFPKGDLIAFVSVIRHLLKDETLKARLLAAAPGHLADHQPDRVASRYLEVIISTRSKSI